MITKYRHYFIIVSICIFLLFFYFYFPELWKGILFALICSFFAELIAISLSELGVYLYTKINFFQIDDWLSKGRLLSLIFVSVHILVAIIFSMMFWSNIT